MIRCVKKSDALRICKIYNYYIENTSITFELTPISVDLMEARIEEIVLANYPYYVYVVDEIVVGFFYLKKWNFRSAYDSTAELSIYIDKDYTSRRIGSEMMSYLFDVVDRKKFHTIVAGITVPNIQSVALHERFGFKQVSVFKEVGNKFGSWRDVGHWQVLL